MPRFIIERTLPGSGQLSPEELLAIWEDALSLLELPGSGIRWLESYVVDDRITCVGEASDPGAIEERMRCEGFAAEGISIERAAGDR